VAEKPSSVAIIALCISIGTAAFSVYQFWNSQREDRIRTAVEISRNFAHDQDELAIEAIVIADLHKSKLSNEQLIRLAKLGDQLEYVSFLANTKRIDEEYLSSSIKCTILFFNMAIDNLKDVTGLDQRDQITKFSSRVQCNLKGLPELKSLPKS
jgi:hypothetical protein